MKKSIAIFGTMALTLSVGVLIGQVGRADSGSTPGSGADPIVTKSYVDQQIAKITGGATPAPQPTTPPPTPGGSTTPVAGIDTFKVIELAPHQVLKGAEGTEMIVRAGSSTAIASDNGGVSDITGGTDLEEGAPVELNHMLLTPRNDGRGIKAGDSKTYVLVRGTYSVQ
ncbi:MAG: hypothetical protein WCC10_01000 [Tumebacillaceae bacterium]